MTIAKFIQLIRQYGLQAAENVAASSEVTSGPVGSYRFYKTKNKLHIYLVPLPAWDSRESIEVLINLLDIEWDDEYNIIGESIFDVVFTEKLIKECLLLEQGKATLEAILKGF